MLMEFTIAGGALYSGVRTYKKYYRKKQLVSFLRPELALADPSSSLVSPAVKRVDVPSEQLHEDRILSLLGKAVPQASSSYVRAFRRDLVIGISSLGFATAGALIYPPLRLLSLPGIIYLFRSIVLRSYKTLVDKGKLSVDVLIILATTMLLATGYFVLATLNNLLFVLHNILLARIKDDSTKDLVDVFRQHPRTVWVLAGGTEVELPFEALQQDDIVVVRAGENIPADGCVIEGLASINQHILTGEGQPVEKGVGEPVFALTTVLLGRICVRVEKAGEETTAAQIGRILNQTVDFKTGMELWAETVTDRSVIPTLALAGLSLPVLGLTGPMMVFISHPKLKTTVASSVSILNYFNLASQKGLLIKDGRTLELLSQVDTIVFDKTGTLTEEQPHISHIHSVNGYATQDILTYAAAAEYRQTHPIALAVVAEAKGRNLSIPVIDEAQYKVGYGLTVTLDAGVVHIGSMRFFEMEGIAISSDIRQLQTDCHVQGYALVLVAVDRDLIGAIELHATIRPEAQEIIQALRQRHITSMYIISGDHEIPTKKLAETLGIDQYFAQTLPENKARLIEQLQREGKTVCFVGDGINDAIALKQAHVSISLRGASTVATDTAQIILMNENLTQLDALFDLARQFETNMRTSFWAVLIPHMMSLGGAFLFQFGPLQAIMLSQTGLVAGLANAMLPRVRARRDQAVREKPPFLEQKSIETSSRSYTPNGQDGLTSRPLAPGSEGLLQALRSTSMIKGGPPGSSAW